MGICSLCTLSMDARGLLLSTSKLVCQYRTADVRMVYPKWPRMALYPHRSLCALACWHSRETRLPLAQVLIVQPRGKKSCSSARLQQFWCWATGSRFFGPCPHFLFHKSAGLQLSRACWLQHGCMRLHTSRAGWRMYEMPVTRRVLHCRLSDALEMHADAGYAVRVDLQFAHCQCIHLYCMHAYPEQAASIFSTVLWFLLALQPPAKLQICLPRCYK